MLTKTSFTSVVMAKIAKAIILQRKTGRSVVHVRNRKGDAFLAIRRFTYRNKVSFQVTDRNGNNMAQHIGQMLMSMAYDISKPCFIHIKLANFLTRYVGYDFQLFGTAQEKAEDRNQLRLERVKYHNDNLLK